MKKACIVGWGAVGAIHAISLAGTENGCFYAVCDNEKEKIEDCLKKHNVKSYLNYSDVLEDDEIDVVHICTPHFLHFEMIRDALLKGKEVISEKPLTMTLDEFNQLISMKENNNLGAVFQNRYNKCPIKFMELSKEMGKLKSARGALFWIRDKEYYQNSKWRGKWATEGGSLMINQAIHTLDLMSQFFGGIKSIRANICNLSLEGVIETEDTANVYMEFSGGEKGIFIGTNAFGVNNKPEIEAVYENGTLLYTDGKLYKNGELVEEDETIFNGKPYWGISHSTLVKKFYDEGIRFSIEDVENTMRAIFALYESGLNGSKVVEI